MVELLGPEGVNFFGRRGVNAADPLHDKDVVNLRSLRYFLTTDTGSTSVGTRFNITNVGDGYPVYGGTCGSTYVFRTFAAGSNLGLISGNTLIYYLQPNISVSGLTASTVQVSTLSGNCNNIVTVDCFGNLTTSANTTVIYPILSAGTATQIISGTNQITIRHTFWETGRTSANGPYTTSKMAIQLQNGYNVNSGVFGIVAGSGNTNSSNYGSILGGKFNSVTGTKYGLISNGKSNFAKGNYSSVNNGKQNTAQTLYSTVVSGYRNNAKGQFNSIVNGSYNFTENQNSLVVGGVANSALTQSSSIITGIGNKANGTFAAIINGYSNSGTNGYSTVINGSNNLSSQFFSLVGSGYKNKATGEYSLIGNGVQNSGYSVYGTVINGNFNLITDKSKNSSILGGRQNLISASTVSSREHFSFIGQGVKNNIFTIYGSVLNGSGNTIFLGYNNTILGGTSNIISGKTNTLKNFNFIGQGRYNKILSNRTAYNSNIYDPIFVSILNGSRNINKPNYSTIINGSNNFIELFGNNTFQRLSGFTTIANGTMNSATTKFSFIGSGIRNRVGNTLNAPFGGYGTVLNGYENIAERRFSVVINGFRNSGISASYTSIINGKYNRATAAFSSILNGLENIASSLRSTIINGSGNTISINSTNSTIAGGYNNIISNNSPNSFISGGIKNTISASSNRSSILAGSGNTIGIYTDNSSIIGGYNNRLYNFSYNTSVIVGIGNKITGNRAAILAGSANTISSGAYNSVIIGGRNNTVGASASNSINLSGLRNYNTGSRSGILAGSANTISSSAYNSAIIGGKNNTIGASTTNSVIIGGTGYTLNDNAHVLVPRLIIKNAPTGGTNFLTIDSNGYVYQTPSNSAIPKGLIASNSGNIDSGTSLKFYFGNGGSNGGWNGTNWDINGGDSYPILLNGETDYHMGVPLLQNLKSATNNMRLCGMAYNPNATTRTTLLYQISYLKCANFASRVLTTSGIVSGQTSFNSNGTVCFSVETIGGVPADLDACDTYIYVGLGTNDNGSSLVGVTEFTYTLYYY